MSEHEAICKLLEYGCPPDMAVAIVYALNEGAPSGMVYHQMHYGVAILCGLRNWSVRAFHGMDQSTGVITSRPETTDEQIARYVEYARKEAQKVIDSERERA